MRAGGDARTWRVVALALALLLALALWKPWDPGGVEFSKVTPSATPGEAIVSDSRSEPSTATPAPLAPTPAPPVHPDAIACISDRGWRAVTRDVTAGRESRTWIAVDPAVAGGPQEESIPTVRLVVGRLIAIGYCVPAELSDDSRDERLWRIELDGSDPAAPPGPAIPIPVSPLQTLVPRASGFADMFGPPPGQSRWSAGRYVFAVDLGGSVRRVWFSIEVVDSEPIPGQQISPASRADPVS